MKKTLYQLTTTYACGGIIVEGNRIVKTCPIYKWMRGKTLRYVIDYLKRKKTFIRKVLVCSFVKNVEESAHHKAGLQCTNESAIKL